MNRYLLLLLALPLVLVACAVPVKQEGTIAQLRNQHIEIKEVEIEGGFEKAMESYQLFLEESHDSRLAPEAIRRLADLKVEKEYGRLTGGDESADRAEEAKPLPAPLPAPVSQPVLAPTNQESASVAAGKDESEGDAEFEKRATGKVQVTGNAPNESEQILGADDLERAGALEAVALYQKLLDEYPLYERNDQVLYQMSRAYEELGRIEEAMKVMGRLVREYPNSHYTDEVQFRRAEYFFTHKHYLDAEDAYKSIVDTGISSYYYQLALYKLGWTFYKQELYNEALDSFIALLDYKVSVGYDFDQTEDETESKRTEDTFRVVSLGFSSLGGASAVVEYFENHGRRSYEDRVYGNLSEYYYAKRRFSDATATYNAFVNRNPFHEKAPIFHMRVIEINIAGGFPTLVIDSKKTFATDYGLKGAYWQHFLPSARPEVLGFLKTNLKDLANHYHALYQDKKRAEEKPQNFSEALHWYREYIASFPGEDETAAINYQLASLLLENSSFAEAAVEYEKTAYDYPRHEKSSEAGYDAVYAYRQYLDSAQPEKKEQVRKEVVRSSMKFADTYPEHEKAAIVLGAAVDDLDDMEEYGEAQAAGRMLIEKFPTADKDILRGAWLVVAHSSFELLQYDEAETGYGEVLGLLPEGDKSRGELVDNLAISIYKQGEEANSREDYRAAADHFLRVGAKAPTSKYRPDADYDAATALILLMDWKMATTVLNGFREKYPGHKLQSEVTKKIAYVYKEDGQLALAADEFERIEKESGDEAVRREALMTAAELHEQVGNKERALAVYRRYVGYFPHPVEPNLETLNKICAILQAQNAQKDYLAELGQIVAIEAAAGGERTPRTRYLAGSAALILTQPSFDRFASVKLVKPFDVNLRKKKKLMKEATQQFNKLLDYEVGEVTAATTYYLAEIFANFSKSLTESERPEGLNPMEMEQYELAIEDQAYPFEEKAISVHESNLQLISRGIYNEWIDKSLQKLAKFVPARYDKPEEESDVVASPDTYMFAYGQPNPLPSPPETRVADEATRTGAPEQIVKTVVNDSPPTAEAGQVLKSGEANEPTQNGDPARTAPSATVGEQTQAEEPTQAVVAAPAEAPEQAVESTVVVKSALTAEPEQIQKTGEAGESTQNGETARIMQPTTVGEQTQTKGPSHTVEMAPAGEQTEAVEPMHATESEAADEQTRTEEPTQVVKADMTGESIQPGTPDEVTEAEAVGMRTQRGEPIQIIEPVKPSELEKAKETTEVKKAVSGGATQAGKSDQSQESATVEESAPLEEAAEIDESSRSAEPLNVDEDGPEAKATTDAGEAHVMQHAGEKDLSPDATGQ